MLSLGIGEMSGHGGIVIYIFVVLALNSRSSYGYGYDYGGARNCWRQRSVSTDSKSSRKLRKMKAKTALRRRSHAKNYDGSLLLPALPGTTDNKLGWTWSTKNANIMSIARQSVFGHDDFKLRMLRFNA